MCPDYVKTGILLAREDSGYVPVGICLLRTLMRRELDAVTAQLTQVTNIAALMQTLYDGQAATECSSR